MSRSTTNRWIILNVVVIVTFLCSLVYIASKGYSSRLEALTQRIESQAMHVSELRNGIMAIEAIGKQVGDLQVIASELGQYTDLRDLAARVAALEAKSDQVVDGEATDTEESAVTTDMEVGALLDRAKISGQETSNWSMEDLEMFLKEAAHLEVPVNDPQIRSALEGLLAQAKMRWKAISVSSLQDMKEIAKKLDEEGRYDESVFGETVDTSTNETSKGSRSVLTQSKDGKVRRYRINAEEFPHVYEFRRRSFRLVAEDLIRQSIGVVKNR